jgi:hypothetical protein
LPFLSDYDSGPFVSEPLSYIRGGQEHAMKAVDDKRDCFFYYIPYSGGRQKTGHGMYHGGKYSRSAPDGISA